MNTKSFKKLTAVVLAVMLTLSMCVTGFSVAAAETDPVEESTFLLTGKQELCNGYEWVEDPEAAPENVMTMVNGVYTITIADVQPAAGLTLKVLEIPAEGDVVWHGDATGNNIAFDVNEACDVTVTYDPATQEVAVTGDSITMVTTLDIEYINAVGNGDGTWLNGANWNVGDRTNEMTEIAPGVYQIRFNDIEEYENYQVKFAANGSWTDNWGGEFEGFGIDTPAEYNAYADILIDTEGIEMCDLVLTLDLSNFDYATKQGATFRVDTIVPEEPTTEAPTTEAPTTQPATTAPVSDVPNDGYYVISNDFKLKLNPCGTNKVIGEIALKAGSYQFKLDNYGTLLGYGKTFTDTTNGLTFQSKFGASATLNATGGVYTFQVNTVTNTLIVKHDTNMPAQYLVGDLNTVLNPVEGRTLAIGTVSLTAGTYKFKISSNDAALGYGGTVNNTTNGRSLTFQTKFSAYCTLNATGGIYTFTLNTATNKLQVSYMEAKDEANDDVHLSGDINAVLDDDGGASNVATATVTLAEGNYSFKVYNYGIAYTGGVKIVDTGLKNLKSSQISPVTLVASGGSYQISFNKTTGQLSIVKE